MTQFGACLDAPAVLSLDRLQFGVRRVLVCVDQVSRRLTQLCLLICSRRLVLGMGAIRRNFANQVTDCPLTSFRITASYCLSSKLRRGYSTELTK